MAIFVGSDFHKKESPLLGLQGSGGGLGFLTKPAADDDDLGLTSGFLASGSIRTRRNVGSYLSRTFGSGGNRNKWTWSAWVKLGGKTNYSHEAEGLFCGAVGGNSNATHSAFYFYNGLLRFGGWNSAYVYSSYKYVDSSAFYHIVLRFDSSLSANDRARFYVNGYEIERSNQGGHSALGSAIGINQSGVHNIGGNDPQSGNSNMHFANIHFCDGLSYGPGEFGEDTNGFWQPKEFTGSYGTTGFWLNFDDSSQIGKDSSGNGNHWTFTNGSINSSITGGNAERDNGACVPLPVGVTTSNYHNISTNNTGALGQYSNFQYQSCFNNPGTFNNTGTYFAVGGGSYAFNGSIPVKSGKWYWEAHGYSGVTSGYVGARPGMGTVDNSQASEGTTNGRFMFYIHPNGNIYVRFDGSTVHTINASSYGDGDRIGWNVDLDNDTFYCYKNGSLIGSYDYSSHLGGRKYWMTPCDGNGSSGSPSFKYHFGEFGFQYAPRDSTFLPLCQAYLPTPIPAPKDYFECLKYSGSGGLRSFTLGRSGKEWQPDLIWIKNLTNNHDHVLTDTCRGNDKVIRSNLTNGEFTESHGIQQFNSDGFSVEGNIRFNASSNDYVAWCWRAGGRPTASNSGGQNPTPGSRMTDGQIDNTPYVTAGHYPTKMTTNTKAGFSIVYYTGTGSNTDIPHGLTQKPNFIMYKALDDGYNWDVYHWQAPNNHQNAHQSTLQLNNNSLPRNVLHQDVNDTKIPVTQSYTGGSGNGQRMVAYVFHEVEGYSRFGYYRGTTSNSRGAYVHCGFKPMWVAVKCLTRSESGDSAWRVMDRKRVPENGMMNAMSFESNYAVQAWNTIHFTGNGFYWHTINDANVNSGGERYVFMAFAEAPQKFATAC